MIQYKQYNSIQAFVKRLEVKDNNFFAQTGASDYYNRPKKSKYQQFATYNEALTALASGDAINAKKIKQTLDVTKKDAVKVDKVKKIIRTSGGGLPNVAAYLSGSQRYMMQRHKIQRKSNIIDVYINTACTWDISNKDILTINVSILQAIQSVERAGYRCNIYVCCAVSQDDDIFAYSACVKPSSAPLNVVNVAFPLVSPDMLRRITFKYLTSEDNFQHSGMGRVLDNEKKEREVLRADIRMPYFSIQACIKKDIYLSSKDRTRKYIDIILNDTK